MDKTRSTFNLSDQARRLLEALAEQYGVNMTAMLEIIIRQKAKEEGLWQPADDTK